MTSNLERMTADLDRWREIASRATDSIEALLSSANGIGNVTMQLLIEQAIAEAVATERERMITILEAQAAMHELDGASSDYPYQPRDGWYNPAQTLRVCIERIREDCLTYDHN